MENMRSKFNVDKDVEQRTCNGITFDSIMEMTFYRDVILPQVESGLIVDYKLQVPYELQPKFTYNGKTILPVTYVADYYIVYADGTEEVIEIKGCPDTVSKLKRKMFWYKYPTIKYTWLTYSKIDCGWQTYEYVKHERAIRKKEKMENKK